MFYALKFKEPMKCKCHNGECTFMSEYATENHLVIIGSQKQLKWLEFTMCDIVEFYYGSGLPYMTFERYAGQEVADKIESGEIIK